MKKIIYFLFLGMITAPAVHANNIQLSNVVILNNGPNNIQVQFDVSWDNSWRVNVGPNNYDGAWVFFKYKNLAGNWVHLTMNGNNNVVPAGFDVYQTNDFLKTGAMIYREPTNLGMGTVTATSVKLGVINSLPYDIDVKGFAMEMVYVPAPTIRPYYGDGNGSTESTNAFHYSENTATTSSVVPMRTDINSYDDDRLEGTTTGLYIYSNDTIQESNPIGTLDPFPTMKALWCMKYELSQAAYRDFLNTLSYQQQETRTHNPPNSVTGTGALAAAGLSRTYIEIATPGVDNATPAVYGVDASGNNVYNEANDGEWVACGYLVWPDLAAYLDWAGLAPMSEFQFERIARGHSSSGPQPAILGEYAWGTDDVLGVAYNLSSTSAASESVTNASTTVGNASYSVSGVPFRNGIFATGISNRITSGASFFGVMEMSGNMEEYIITVGVEGGRSCRFVPNGNGNISTAGNAQLSVGGAGFWPGMEGNITLSAANTCSNGCEVTGSSGIVLKGGSFSGAAVEMQIGRRNYFNPNISTRVAGRGGRGVLYIR